MNGCVCKKLHQVFTAHPQYLNKVLANRNHSMMSLFGYIGLFALAWFLGLALLILVATYYVLKSIATYFSLFSETPRFAH